MMNRSGWDTFQWRFLGSRTIMTRDPRNLQALHATQFRDFGMGENRKNNFRLALGRGIFAADGDEWRHARGFMRPYFLTEHVKRPNIEPHVRKLVRSIETGPDGWTEAPVDLQPLFYTFALEVSCDIFFGLGPDELEDQSDTFSAFAAAFDIVQEYLSVRTKLGWAYFLWDGPKFRRAIAQVNHFVDEVVQRTISNSHSKGTPSPTFLDQLLASVPGHDPSLIRSQLLHLLIASRDTVAVTLGWTFHHLSRHPDEYTSLRASILSRTESDASSEHIRHVLLESLRLHPAIPLNTRTALRDTSLPRGGGANGDDPIFVRKGDEILYSAHALHRNPAIWGPDAEEFRPARWTGRRRQAWEFLPFNGGPRVCLGQRLAMVEMEGIIREIARRFEVLEPVMREGEEDGVARVTLTMSSAGGVRVRLREQRP
ncbi:cytochrome P450 [Cercophora newfieldiana]|uniref:Cytochrome P450 n=1 Tax=Cercophora newfieldiana TaxID=92897 RepID=A0AA39Y6L7_9PEZI|nr:cytochrome P450 [Cercophora newfieldiana]